MKKHFYSEIIEVHSIYTSLYLLEMKDHERKELIEIVASSVHHVVLDTMLSELSEKDKKSFLEHITEERHEEIWNLLNSKVKNPEEKIRKAVDKLKKELHKDIQRVKKK